MNHEIPNDSGSGKDFLKELSRDFESNTIAWLIDTNADIGTTMDSPTASNNDKSDNWPQGKDAANEISKNPYDDQKSMPTVTHDEIGYPAMG
jgi:hypothetical protein